MQLVATAVRPKAETGNAKHVAASLMPGAVVGVSVTAGEEVTAGQKVLNARSDENGNDSLCGAGGQREVAEVLVTLVRRWKAATW